MLSHICVLLLMIVAGCVSVFQWAVADRAKSTVWAWIVAYWFILTVKNFFDLLNL